MLGEPLPLRYKMAFELAWLGDLSGDLFEVEIRESKDMLGWLYSNLSIVFYRYEGNLYECWVSSLKNIVEDRMKEKKFSIDPEANCLQRDTSGRIVAQVWMSEVVEISKRVDNEH